MRSRTAAQARWRRDRNQFTAAASATPDGELTLADGRRLQGRPDRRRRRQQFALARFAWSFGQAQISGRRLHAAADGQDRGGARRDAMAPRPSNIGRARGVCSIRRAARPTFISRSPCSTATRPPRRCRCARTNGSAHFRISKVLIDRIGEQGRYDRFDLIKLKRWSAGRVALIGDAAHALPPNIGQGGGCAMMNALSLAVYLDRDDDRRRRRSHHGSATSARSPSTPSAFRIFSACRRPGRRRCAPRRSVLPAAPNGWCGSARAPRCTGRQEPKRRNVRSLKTEW